MKQRWPNLFVVGAAKAGTTSLHYYLNQHPDIYMSPLKEPHFFSQISPAPELKSFFQSVQNEAEYLALFAGAHNEAVVGEASTSYLWDEQAPNRIYSSVPRAKLVIMLRNPVDRAYSHYLNDAREGIETRAFLEAVTQDFQRQTKGWGVSQLYVDLGFYCGQVSRYLNTFPRDRIFYRLF